MCLRIAKRLHSALCEGYFTGAITSITGGKGNIAYTKNSVVDDCETQAYHVQSPEAVHREGLHEMFPDYYPCEQKGELSLNITFHEKSLAKGQDMRGMRAGMGVRFDVVLMEGDSRDVPGQPLNDMNLLNHSEPLDDIAHNQSSNDTVGFTEAACRQPKEEVANQRKRKVYKVNNLMIISSGTNVPSHAAFAKPRSEFTLL